MLIAQTVRNILRINCPYCFRYQNYTTRKRFYRNTSVVRNDNTWEVTLDHRRLKTPNGRVLTVYNEPLARAIAAEWDAQKEHIVQPVMHLTALCNTALDNPGKLTRHDIVSYILDYLSTDTLLFLSDDEEELKAAQEKKWFPIIEWFQETFNVTQEVSTGLVPPPVATETRGELARYLLSYDFTSLNAICFGVEALKSPLLMLACVMRRLEPNEAVLLARLEEEYQEAASRRAKMPHLFSFLQQKFLELQQWGRVPWAHELSQAELTSRVCAALLLVHCSSETHTAKTKKHNTL